MSNTISNHTKSILAVVVWLTISSLSAPATQAQFPQRLPKLPKIELPKLPKIKPRATPAPAETRSRDVAQPAPTRTEAVAPARRTAQTGSAKPSYTRPEPPAQPVFLKSSVSVKAHTVHTYWKFPNQSEYSSWIPRLQFDFFYDDSARLRYVAEYFNPDGSSWFSETLRQGFLSNDKTVSFQSDSAGELLNTKAVTTTGAYGLKITNSKTGEVVFQGKFKVGKFKDKPNEPRYKNHFDFYVEHDWLLALGYLGFESNTSWDSPYPTIFLWFKGDVEEKELEARLYYKGEEVATTDAANLADINQGETRLSTSEQSPALHQWRLWEFSWFTFHVRNGTRGNRPNVKYTEDNPGEYTVKIFRKGTQVREVKFSVGPDGRFVDSGFAGQINLINYRMILPVKVMGTQDNWNATGWKTDAFYGNPLSGFSAP